MEKDPSQPTEDKAQDQEEDKRTPHEILLDEIYDKSKPKEDRAQLILKTLKDEPEYFYELDFFQNNFYSHVLENFTQDESDIELFKSLTIAVIRDIKNRNFTTEFNEVKVELFNSTFHGDFKNNFGVPIYLAKNRKYLFITPFLDCFIEEGLTDRIRVEMWDNTKRTMFHYI